jgi:hypothetical protein
MTQTVLSPFALLRRAVNTVVLFAWNHAVTPNDYFGHGRRKVGASIPER